VKDESKKELSVLASYDAGIPGSMSGNVMSGLKEMSILRMWSPIQNSQEGRSDFMS